MSSEWKYLLDCYTKRRGSRLTYPSPPGRSHFIIVYIFILASCLVHTALYLVWVNGSQALALSLNRLGAAASVLILLGYHLMHYVQHLWPYLKLLSMFENRSFYSPPAVSIMETWTGGEERGRRRPATTAASSGVDGSFGGRGSEGSYEDGNVTD